jgi:hypothetical protein
MSLFFWNWRGLANYTTIRELRNLVAQNRPSVLCVVETQIQSGRARNLSRSFGFDNCYAVSSDGRSGGLAMYWNNNLRLELIHFSQYHIDMIVSEAGKEKWRLTCIYGEAQTHLRHKTWDLLKFLSTESDLPWISVGDYNEVLRPEEHLGVGQRDPLQMRGFREAVDVCGLIDLGYIGRDWTFEKKVRGGSYTRVRLDRGLASLPWWEHFPNAVVRNLTAAKSDHCPLLVVLDRTESSHVRGHRQFRYELMWEAHDSFHSFLEDKWKEKGTAMSLHEVTSKLQNLSGELSSWSTDVFGNVRKEIHLLMSRLAELRDDPHRLGPSHEEIKICDRIVELNHREEVMWRQRSRVQWLREGDNNTKIFHQKASMRKRRNKIEQLSKADGSVTEDVEEMRGMANDFFNSLYEAEGTYNMDVVLNTVPCKVSREMNDLLLAPYSESEVKFALFQMFPTKAPGPDGMPAHFYQKHWDLCGPEISTAVLDVLNKRVSPENINQTVLVLIPKVSHPTLLSQFRPISLCNVILKIVSKAQANRLKVILPDIISEEQSAFVPGRLITDNIISAFECLHFMKKKRPQNQHFCAFKLDMTKAYDRLEWNYLQAIMLKLGFDHSWVSSIMSVVTSVSFSVLFNGSKLDDFKPSRGIRQGDPISPYLFLLAVEGLSCLLRSRGMSENLVGIQVAPTAPRVNHLLFADDSLLFLKANSGAAVELSEVLQLYCHASGQRINLSKSSIHFSKGCPRLIREDVKQILQVSNESLSEKYLGMPTEIGHSVNDAFKNIKERIWNNILGWMEKFLSFGGKGILIKSVIQAIPTFSMSCFKLPRGLCEHINSAIRSFWWGSSQGKRKTHWVSWSDMTKPKFDGGLGFRDMELFNIALLARQAWRLLSNPTSLSARILKALYYPENDILTADLGPRPSKIWRAISEGRDALKLGLIKRIGSGEQTRIWSDNWLPRDSRRCPVVSINEYSPVWVSQLIDHANRSWNLEQLRLNFLPMDIEIIRSIPLGLANHEDFWAWHFEKHGNFSVRSAYRMLSKTKNEREAWLDGTASSSGCNNYKNWTSMWHTKVPSKIYKGLSLETLTPISPHRKCSSPTSDV